MQVRGGTRQRVTLTSVRVWIAWAASPNVYISTATCGIEHIFAFLNSKTTCGYGEIRVHTRVYGVPDTTGLFCRCGYARIHA